MARRRGTQPRSIATQDDLANFWGAGLVAGAAIGGAVSKTTLDSVIRTTIPGFRFLSCIESGTTANERAVTLATDGVPDRCLFGAGSYCAGAGFLHGLTSSDGIHNKRLSLIKTPDVCSTAAQEQTIALPYHLPIDNVDDEILAALEVRCLDALQVKLTMGAMAGRSYRALLLEYILSGCGGELTYRFLERLGDILRKYNVSVVVDEVMTGGRVGPTMAMTSSMPSSFVNCVKFITMGKSFGCGLVLVSVSHTDYCGRGTTTEIVVDEAYWKFVEIKERIRLGMIDSKRKRVLDQLKLTGNEHWGRGLLMFSAKSRSHVQGNMWNRLLPLLEDGIKTSLVKGFAASIYDRVSVNEHIQSRINTWLQHMSDWYDAEYTSPYTVELGKFISRSDAALFYPKEFLKHMDAQEINVERILAKHKDFKKRKLGPDLGRCSAQHKTLVYGAAKEASTTSNGFISLTRKGNKRDRCYRVEFNNLY